MAKYSVTHTCGHTSEIQLFGKHTGRYSHIEWLESQPCNACKAAEAAKAALQAGLPALQGSEKQVAWAEQIRTEALARLQAEFAARNREDFPAAATAAKVCALETRAGWWIDHRNWVAATDILRNMHETHREELQTILDEIKATRSA